VNRIELPLLSKLAKAFAEDRSWVDGWLADSHVVKPDSCDVCPYGTMKRDPFDDCGCGGGGNPYDNYFACEKMGVDVWGKHPTCGDQM